MSRPSPPESLWRDNTLFLPATLADALRCELQSRGLFQEATGPYVSEKELFGGSDGDEASKHFTHRFKTSAARVGFVTVDPSGNFLPVSNDLIATLLDGRVAILDIPCGSGGGLYGFLETVAELRRQNALPQLPVQLRIFGADISCEARTIHLAMLQRLLPGFDKVGIRITANYHDWDVRDRFSTAKLMTAWMADAPDAEVYLVFVSAFSGFADKQDNSKIVLEAFSDIALRLHDRLFLMTWVEPIMNESKRFLPRLIEWFVNLCKSQPIATSSQMEEEFSYQHPFNDEKLTGRAKVVNFQKTRGVGTS